MFILSVVLIPLTGNNTSNNPTERLAEIRGKISSAEQRVRDLEALLTAFILQADPGIVVTGVNNDLKEGDANEVRQELYRARAYEGELRTGEQFWNQIVSENKNAQQKTAEMFKPAG
jgi:phosphatidylserine/phosphatidylglycerophosphate/cardiolipin synthase-like enzyme